MKQLTVKAGKTYWGVVREHTGLKSATVIELVQAGYRCRVKTRHLTRRACYYLFSSECTRECYPYATKRAAQKALVRVLTKDADKAFTAWNKLANRLHKAKEVLTKL